MSLSHFLLVSIIWDDGDYSQNGDFENLAIFLIPSILLESHTVESCQTFTQILLGSIKSNQWLFI